MDETIKDLYIVLYSRAYIGLLIGVLMLAFNIFKIYYRRLLNVLLQISYLRSLKL